VKVKLAIREQISFAAGQTRIRSRYLPVLKQLAARLKGSSLIKKVRIDGYADDRGDDAANLRLSEQRAREVMDFLLKNGVEPWRLEPRGHGRPPQWQQESKGEQEENRRVGFTIVDPPQDGE
jgi:outer membrane protein OmpA-like peptidoglycan-associated protein